MAEDVPTLEVGFAIETGSSYDELLRLQEFMNSTEAKIVRDAATIERATGNMINLAGAKVQVESFGNAHSRAMANLTRDTHSAEKAAERMVSQIDRQIETFGKSASEIRQARAEMRALAAEQFGLTEVADRLRSASAEMARLELASGKLSTTGKLAGYQLQNLGYQGQDLAVQLFAASQSSDPLRMAFMALVQQGSQIYGIMGQAGVGVRAVGAAFLDMSKSILIATATNPYLLAGAAIIGTFAGAVSLLNREANDGAPMQDYLKSLGLTAEEIKKLDNATVTWGDTAKAVFQVAGRAIWDQVGPSIMKVWDLLKQYWSWAIGGAKDVANFIINYFVGAFSAIGKTWRMFPAVIGDAFYSAVNAAISAINMLLRAAITGLNWLGAQANKILPDAFKIPELSAPQIAAVSNQYAGAARTVARTVVGVMQKEMGTDRIGQAWGAFSGAVTSQAIENAKDRLRAQAESKGLLDDKPGKRGGTAAKAKELSELQKAYEEAVKAAKAYIATQAEETAKLGLNAKELRLYADAAAIAKAPTTELKLAILGAAAARELAYSAKSAQDFEANVMKPLRDELALYGLVGPARAAAALALEKDAFIAKNMGDGLAVATQRWQEYYDAKMALISRDQQKDDEAERIRRLREEMDALTAAARDAGNAIARAFGRVGGAVSDVIAVLGDYQKRQAEIDELRTKAMGNQTKLARLDAAQARLQIQSYGALAGAAKGFFKEGSDGYKAMAAAEKAFALVQLANTAVNVAAGAAKMFASLGPWAFPVVAAMVGVMAALGFGGGGGAAAPPVTNDGSGTVLGDPAAQSESIKNAINALKDVDTLMLNYSRQMAGSLRSIESQIGNFASVLVRQGDSINANGGIAQGFNPNAIGSLLGNIPLIGGFLKGLFGTKTTVLASGLYAGAQSLGSILGGGFDASYYSDVQKKKKFLGITTSTKYSTSYSAADPLLENQFTLILRSFNDAIKAAAGPLGEATSTIQQRLNGFVVNIGKIDLQGLTGAEIEDRLNAVFGAAADNMARAAFPFIDQFQKAGEGAFETLIRVASTLEAVGSSLDLLGQSAQNMTIGVKLGLADQFDSISDLTNAVDAYFQAFYTKEEQAAARTAQMGKVFESLGLTMPTTLAGFRQLVEAQNLNTAAGRAAYATLLQLAPAFADLQAAMDGAKSAADIATERQDLQRQLLELQGDTAALRALQLAKLDESNRALQLQIWAIQDAQAAAKAADELRKAWQSVGDGLMDEVRRIRGLTDVAGAGGFAALMSQFNAATNAARGGDIDAAKSLPQLSQSLLAAAADAATSRQELDRIRAQIAASLEATYGLVSSLGGSAATSDAALLNLGASSQPAVVAVNDNGASISTSFADLRDEIAQQRADLNAGLATIAANTGKVAKKLEDVTAQSGGDAVSTVAAA